MSVSDKKRSIIFIVVLIGVTLCLVGAASGVYLVLYDYEVQEEIVYEPGVFYENVEENAFYYFWEEANPNTGLIKDKTTNNEMCSIAAVGPGLSAICIGENRGWITENQAENRILTTLETFRDNVEGSHGFHYHFVWMDNGNRYGTSEISPIDSAKFIAGALHAAQHFSDNNQIVNLAQSLYENQQWSWLQRSSGLLASKWTPESGLFGEREGYDEYILTYLLALGSPTYPLPASSWNDWADGYAWTSYKNSGKFLCPDGIMKPTAYLYHFPAMWIDFRNKHDDYADYWDMMGNAMVAMRENSRDWMKAHADYDNNLWGWTAVENQDGYLGWDPFQGTVAPAAVAGSVAWIESSANSQLKYQYNTYGENIWGKYGFKDSFDHVEGWWGEKGGENLYVGINKGPEVLLIEDHRTGLVWNKFMQSEYINEGMRKADFVYEVYPDNDTFADNNSPTTNYGDNTWISVENNTENQKRIFFKFNLSSEVPSGFRIGKAELKMYLYNRDGSGTLTSYELDNDNWNENNLVWDNKPGNVGSALSTASIPSENNWVTFDVTTWVDNQFYADNTSSIVLKVDNNFAEFRSNEYSDNTKQRPYLGITLAPVAPKLISPTNGGKAGRKPSFKWTPGAEAKEQRLLVDSNSDFSSPTENRLFGATENKYTIPLENLLSLDNYYWKVISIEDGTKTSSRVWKFTAKSTVTDNFYPTDDTYSQESNPNSTAPNSGENWRIGVSGRTENRRRGFLKFDLSSITTGYNVTEAKLNVYDSYPNTRRSRVFARELNNDSWKEENLTWDNAPSYGSQIDGISLPENNSWVNWTVTEWTDNQYKEDNTVSTVLSTTDSLEIWFISKDDSETPYLEVTYSLGPGLISLKDGEHTIDKTPTLKWISGINADNHRLVVNNDSNFADAENEIDKNLGADTESYTISQENALSYDNYYWKVMASAGGVKRWSSVYTFEVSEYVTENILPSMDAYTDESAPGDTKGTTNSKRLATSGVSGYYRRSFLNFDTSPIPPGYGINEARLRIYTESVGSSGNPENTVYACELDNDNWSGTTLTWDNQPDNGSRISENTHFSSGTWTSWDITSWAENQYNEDNLISSVLRMKEPASTIEPWFESAEEIYGRAPHLKITYSIVSAPSLISPENDTTTSDNTPTFEWSPGGNAESHRLVIDNSSDFSDGENIYDNSNLGATEGTCTIENELPADDYYWKVIASNGDVERESDKWTLTITSAPILSSPEDGTTTLDNTPTFEWKISGNPDSHRLVIDNSSNFSDADNIYDNSNISSTENTCTIENELPADNYYWKVAGVKNGVETWSSTWTLEVVESVTSTIYPSDDAKVDSQNSGTNYGSDTNVAVAGPQSSWYKRTFLKFDLSSLRSGYSITEAKLSLYKYDDLAAGESNRDVGAYRVDNDTWSESSITWTNQPGIGSQENYISTATTTGLWEDWDVTSWVDSQHDNDDTTSIALKMVDERSDWNSAEPWYYSKEYDGYDPYLVVTVSQS